MNLYRKYIKRGLDIALSLAGLAVLLPLILMITVLLCCTNRGRPFFVQKRPGKNGNLFWLLKFKTMNDKRDAEGKLLPDEKRLTLTGKFIRKTSLDELPQLLNVLKGDMSLVGPRPLLIAYLPLYTAHQNRRHEVQPVITGWAQVNGRNAISWEQKFDLDVWYVDHISLATDCTIIWYTIKKVFTTEGISQQGHATMPHFTGASRL